MTDAREWLARKLYQLAKSPNKWASVKYLYLEQSDAILSAPDSPIAALVKAAHGMLMEWEKFTRYGSPMAKAANERVAAVRAALAPFEEPKP